MDKRKEAARLFWMVKGYLMPEHFTDSDIEYILTSYTKRVWHNHEVNDEGFEEAWENRE